MWPSCRISNPAAGKGSERCHPPHRPTARHRPPLRRSWPSCADARRVAVQQGVPARQLPVSRVGRSEGRVVAAARSPLRGASSVAMRTAPGMAAASAGRGRACRPPRNGWRNRLARTRDEVTTSRIRWRRRAGCRRRRYWAGGHGAAASWSGVHARLRLRSASRRRDGAPSYDACKVRCGITVETIDPGDSAKGGSAAMEARAFLRAKILSLACAQGGCARGLRSRLGIRRRIFLMLPRHTF